MRIFKLLIASALSCLMTMTLSGQEKLSREQYIQTYKSFAKEQMEIYGIPASITMAQALLESDNGNGRLAREANNHFGIKCKKEWTGETISHDDDAAGECFRKYANIEESYKDHSEFLDNSPRYQDLFKLDPLDYKGWAYGLKKAGYATNPQYAELLIKIIEDNNLYALDTGKEITPKAPVMGIPPSNDVAEQAPQKNKEGIDVDNYAISINGQGGRHSVYSNNGSEFILAKAGDTYPTLSAETGISVKKLLKFNDASDTDQTLAEGDMVYLKQKSKRSENGKLIHIAKDGETLRSISQMYGIRLNNLCNINRRPKDSEVRAGQQIRLM